MTAIILACGDSSAMKPLSCSIPKALLPVCNIPVLECTINHLRRCGTDRIIIVCDKPSGQLADFAEGLENPPLLYLSNGSDGSAAAAANAVESYGIKEREAVLILRGDLLTDFDFKELFRAHKYADALFTAVLKKNQRPWEHTAALAENGILKGIFTDLPRESTVTDDILTGIAVINGGFASELHKYGEDIFTDVISRIITDGIKVNVHNADGNYTELNTPAELYAANAAAANGDFDAAYPEFSRGLNESADAKIYIGRNAEISSDAVISGFAVIGSGCSVGSLTRLHDCVLFDNVYVGERCRINGAVIGKNTRICSGGAVFEGAIVGSNAVISEDACVNAGVRIWDGRHVEPFSCASADLKYGFAKPVVIDDDGITGETNGFITPQSSAMTGSALVGIGAKVGIGCRDSNASYSLAMAAAAGVMAAGGDAWFFGETTEPELSFCIRKSRLSCGCFFDAGINAKIRLFSADGMSLSRHEEKIVEGALNRGEYRRSGYKHFGALRQCGAIRELYRENLLARRPTSLEGIRAVISTASRRVSETCELLLDGINDKNGSPIVFHIGSDGVRVSAYTEETGYIFSDKLIMLCCLRRFRQGKNAALPYNFPTAADKLAEKYGCKVLRWSGCTDKIGADKAARKLAEECDFAFDGAALMLETLGIMSGEKLSLADACGELPEFATVNRFVAFDVNSSHNLSKLRNLCGGSSASADGVRIDDSRGRVLIRPVKTGRGVMMHVESYAAEIASEICDFYQDKLLEKRDNG